MANKIPLTTLKQCLQFLEWLRQSTHMRGQSSSDLHRRLNKYYNGLDSRRIESALKTFLESVYVFYKRLCNNQPAGSYGSVDAQQVTDALIEGIPKLLAALYYLWYCINNTFDKLGGGGWQRDWLGYDAGTSYGGDLANYLHEKSGSNKYGGMIPGGFSYGDVKYGYYDTSGYYQGYNMAEHLEKLLKKDSKNYNFFRDIFATSVLPDAGVQKVNTGNAVALVGTFCQIVLEEKDGEGGDLLVQLNNRLNRQMKSSGKFICWKDLKTHCSNLKNSFGKLFKSKRFSHTGQSLDPKFIVSKEFAGKTADWLRENLTKVRGKLKDIDTNDSAILRNGSHLGAYCTNNLFPYGFIFDDNRYLMTQKDVQDLKKDWRGAIGEFFKANGGLQRLREILEGNYTVSCPKPVPPPVTSSEAPNAIAPKTKAIQESTSTKPAVTAEAAKTEAAKPVVTKADKAQPTATKTEATKPVVNQAETSPNQNKGQKAGNPTTSSVGTSPSPPTGSAGAPAPATPKNSQGPQGSPDSKQTIQVQAGQNPVQPQQPIQPQQTLPPPTSPPGPPAAPGSPSKPGSGGGSPNGGGATDQKAAVPPSPVKPPSSGVQPERSGTPGASASGGGQGSASVPTQQGITSRGAQGGDPNSSQTVVPQAPVSSQSPGVATQGSPSSSVPAPVGGQGTGGTGPTSGTTQQNGQGASQNSAAATTTASTGSGADPGGGGGVGGSNGKVDPEEERLREHLEVYGSKVQQRNYDAKKNMENIWKKAQEKFEKINEKNFRAKLDERRNTQTAVNRPQPPPIPRTQPTSQLHPTPLGPAPSRPTQPTPSVQPSRPTPTSPPAPASFRASPTTRVSNQRPYFVPGEGRPGQEAVGTHGYDPMQLVDVDGSAVRDKPDIKRQKQNEQGVMFHNAIKISHNLQSERNKDVEEQQPQKFQQNRDEAIRNWTNRKEDGQRLKKYHDDVHRIQKALHGSNKANEARLRHEEEQKKFVEAAPQLDGSQPSDDIYGERWPWWYPGLLYREVTGKPIDDDMPERLQDQRERLFHEKIQDDLGQHIDERKALQTLEREGQKQIQQHDEDAEEKLRQGRVQHVQLNPPITTVLPPLPDPRELPDTLKHPDITFKVVDDTDRQSFAQKSKDAAQRINDYHERQKQRVADEKKVYKEELEQKEKNATQAHVESIKRAGEIVQSENLEKMFHGGDFDIALAPSLRVDDFEENAHEAYRIYGPSPKNTTDEFVEYNPKWDNVINYGLVVDPNPNMCNNPWNYAHDSATSPTLPPPPDSDHLPPPTNVKAMLFWLVGLNTYGLIAKIERHMEGMLMILNGDTFYPKYALQVNGDLSSLSASHIADTLTEVCLYSAHVLNGIMRMKSKDALSPIDFKSEYGKFRYSPDPACLLCQLRDYAYACCHQLEFLKSQCKRDKLSGGWQSHEYGGDPKISSPLQSFLTDDWDCPFKTHPFDPCNLCLKSRIRMGFRKGDLPKTSQTGSTISTILSPTCGGEDPLLTLASYLNCLTRRTPRTTGELLSFFHNFGMELHGYASKALSSLGTALSTSHHHCPDWDRLDDSGLGAVKGIRGSESINTIYNSNHSNDHPRTLSTLLGCNSDATICHPRMSPITYRAYALYSQSFAHTYLSWTVYLPDRLWESLHKLFYELKKHDYAKCSSLYLCSTALPLLYTHGFTPPEVGSQPKLTCSDVIAKLKEIVDGKPIASLMTAMDDFLYGIREPFIFTLVALWSLAFLIFANTMLYRLDVLHIRSHLIRSKASHRIDVKALLTKGRKMLSLYKDVDYFDEDPIGQLSF